MKELSIEQKAKRYDEAKLRMIAAYNSNRCTIGFMNEIFPELKESEGEKIKRIIKSALKTYFEGNLSVDTNDTDYAECLTWLEKQGERKSDWSEDDEEMFNEIILDLKVLKHRDTGEAGKAAYQREIDWLESLKPQSQWKPSEEQLKSLKEVTDVGHFTSYPNALETLYEQLKKLRGE